MAFPPVCSAKRTFICKLFASRDRNHVKTIKHTTQNSMNIYEHTLLDNCDNCYNNMTSQTKQIHQPPWLPVNLHTRFGAKSPSGRWCSPWSPSHGRCTAPHDRPRPCRWPSWGQGTQLYDRGPMDVIQPGPRVDDLGCSLLGHLLVPGNPWLINLTSIRLNCGKTVLDGCTSLSFTCYIFRSD